MTWLIVQNDARQLPLRDQSVQCVVTSPPYWGLRDYGTASWQGGDDECDHINGRPGSDRADGIVGMVGHRNRDGAGAFAGDCRKCGATRVDSQIGLEQTPQEYVDRMVGVFREVRRVLRDDGTCWVNLGDSYASAVKGSGGPSDKQLSNAGSRYETSQRLSHGLKDKDLVGIPWRIAFALQADGWYLRSDIIWSKPNPMPESVTDRPTKAHEYVFLLAKRERYYFDQDAVREPHQDQKGIDRFSTSGGSHPAFIPGENQGFNGVGWKMKAGGREYNEAGRNIRTVWEIATQPYPESHFATFPEELAIRCIKAGSKPGSIVLDPFGGAGTVALVADKLNRTGIALELKREYCQMAHKRCYDDSPLFA